MTESQKRQTLLIFLIATVVGCAFFILNDFEFVFFAFWLGMCTSHCLILISTTNIITNPNLKIWIQRAGVSLGVTTLIYINYVIFFSK